MSKRRKTTVPRWTWIEGPSLSTVDSEDGKGPGMLRLYQVTMHGYERASQTSIYVVAIEPCTAISAALDRYALEERFHWEHTPERMRSAQFNPTDMEVIEAKLLPGLVVVAAPDTPMRSNQDGG